MQLALPTQTLQGLSFLMQQYLFWKFPEMRPDRQTDSWNIMQPFYPPRTFLHVHVDVLSNRFLQRHKDVESDARL